MLFITLIVRNTCGLSKTRPKMLGSLLIWTVLSMTSGFRAATSAAKEDPSLQRIQNVTEGQSVLLTCGATGRIGWYIGTKQIFGDPRRQMDKDGNLHFSYVDVADTAVYKCGIANKSQVTFVKSIKLNVMKGDPTNTSAQLIYSSETTNASLGHNVTQQCIFSGRPVPAVNWYLDGKLVTNTTRVKLSYTTVTIRNVSEEDAGIYRCIGKNEVGFNSQNVTLIVIASDSDAPSVLLIVLVVVFIVLVLTGTVVCIMIRRLKKPESSNRKTNVQKDD